MLLGIEFLLAMVWMKILITQSTHGMGKDHCTAGANSIKLYGYVND